MSLQKASCAYPTETPPRRLGERQRVEPGPRTSADSPRPTANHRPAWPKYHREDGHAREWPAQGAKAWYHNGKLHREDGPAMEGPLGKSWYRKGKRHREEGPAVEHADGRKVWYRHGKELTASEFAAIREKELAEIGEAFKTGLTREIAVSRPRRLKTSS